MALGADHARGERSSSVSKVDKKEGLTSIVQTRNHNPGTGASGEKEACLDDGEDGKTACAFEDMARDDLISGRSVEQTMIVQQ